MDVRGWSRRYPVGVFCGLTFVISWGWILLVVLPGGFPVEPERFEQQMLFVYPAMFVGPMVSGLVVTALVSGTAGLRELLARLGHWRVAVKWYAAALLSAPVAILVVLLLLSLISPSYLPLLYTSDDKAFLVWYPLIAGVATAFFEEIGWTGFATATLLTQRRGVLWTGLVIGLLFAVWNSLVVYWSGAALGELPAAIFLPIALFTWLPTYRVLVTWLYDRTRSLLLAMIMSASLWASWISLTPQAALAGAPLAAFYVALTVALWAVVGLVLLQRGHHLPSLLEGKRPIPGG